MDVSSVYGPNILGTKLANSDIQASNEEAERTLSKVIRPEQWSPWKSFGKLLDEAVLEMGWQERYSLLRDIVSEYGREKKGYLTLGEFLNILNDNPITDEQYRSIFYNLMDRNQDGVVNEVEFTSGMLSLSPLAKNDPKTSIGQLRLQFIFLYYDTDRNGLLNLNELKRMIIHISSIRSLARKTVSMSDSKAREYAIHLIAHYDGVFGFNAFYNSVKNNILKGTGWLLRTRLDLVDFINGSVDYQRQFPNNSTNALHLSRPSPKNHIQSFSSQSFNRDIPSMGLVEQRQCSTFLERGLGCGPNLTFFEAIKNQKEAKINSMGILDIFPNNLQNQVFQSLEQRVIDYYMNVLTNTGNDADLEEKMYINNVLSHSEIMNLCDRVVQIIRNENSLIEVDGSGSARIFGGIHGQLIDLLHFFEHFSWPHFHRGDILSMKYIFLGDYVDQGKFSLEVISILFSLKIMFPDKVFLLRGNHEDAYVNSIYGFRLECKQKFGVNGDIIWERINDAFEFLSISALFDNNVLCIHSGIGRDVKKVNHLSNIPKPIHVRSEELLKSSDFYSTRISEIDRQILECLWSNVSEMVDIEKSVNRQIDETDAEQSREVCAIEKDTYSYDSYYIKDFMDRNSIKLIIETSDYCRDGYGYSTNGGVISLISTTNFCNRLCNDAAVLVITRGIGNELIQYNQIIKYQDIDNSFGWMDQVNPVQSQSYVKGKPNSVKIEAFGENYQLRATSKKNPMPSLGIGRAPNSSSTLNYSPSPKSSTVLINTDEKPITPSKISNLHGRPVNLTAF
ncbi:calcineurin-like phosphatase [Cryptosporidium canis]|uniref:Serine/threonine-protein phosphatase n=1 Tax=Cryptosporidium canis TaxID=195482 RepID=A0ABQ8P897_9CRYT|nr:calcineurin-like phosphatase [Cryptosporidium canis]KAJ1614046.1 calcineurin-like phosphatase [Cryptosporidium canis]